MGIMLLSFKSPYPSHHGRKHRRRIGWRVPVRRGSPVGTEESSEGSTVTAKASASSIEASIGMAAEPLCGSKGPAGSGAVVLCSPKWASTTIGGGWLDGERRPASANISGK
jgi:hypothetical protein